MISIVWFVLLTPLRLALSKPFTFAQCGSHKVFFWSCELRCNHDPMSQLQSVSASSSLCNLSFCSSSLPIVQPLVSGVTSGLPVSIFFFIRYWGNRAQTKYTTKPNQTAMNGQPVRGDRGGVPRVNVYGIIRPACEWCCGRFLMSSTPDLSRMTRLKWAMGEEKDEGRKVGLHTTSTIPSSGPFCQHGHGRKWVIWVREWNGTSGLVVASLFFGTVASTDCRTWLAFHAVQDLKQNTRSHWQKITISQTPFGTLVAFGEKPRVCNSALTVNSVGLFVFLFNSRTIFLLDLPPNATATYRECSHGL